MIGCILAFLFCGYSIYLVWTKGNDSFRKAKRKEALCIFEEEEH